MTRPHYTLCISNVEPVPGFHTHCRYLPPLPSKRVIHLACSALSQCKKFQLPMYAIHQRSSLHVGHKCALSPFISNSISIRHISSTFAIHKRFASSRSQLEHKIFLPLVVCPKRSGADFLCTLYLSLMTISFYFTAVLLIVVLQSWNKSFKYKPEFTIVSTTLQSLPPHPPLPSFHI